MGLLKLNLVYMAHHRRRRHRIQSREVSSPSRAKSGCSPYQQPETSLAGQINRHPSSKKGKKNRHPGPSLPEDIWCQIHFLLPMRDAARLACVSRSFAHSWRYYPNLVFSKNTLGINVKEGKARDRARDFTSKVDCILEKHSGVGVKTLSFDVGSVYNTEDCCHLDSWLHWVVKPGIEEIKIDMSRGFRRYKFPCSLLSGGTGDSLRHLILDTCHFHATELVCLKRLTILDFYMVHISDDELECLLSNSFSLEQLKLISCRTIVCLKIPLLQQLRSLTVRSCSKLQVIENKAPNLSLFSFVVDGDVQVSLRGLQPIKALNMHYNNSAFYALTTLPSIMPNLEALCIVSNPWANNNTQMASGKFLHLKFLSITIGGRGFDFLSLVSFFNSSPSLETLKMHVLEVDEERISMVLDPLDLRTVPEHFHDKLKSVKIANFCSAKSLIELTCHILQSMRSLNCLTLDTTKGYKRCFGDESDKCWPISKAALVEAHRALLAVQTYIKPNVPPTVEFNALEPCNRCHSKKMTKLL